MSRNSLTDREQRISIDIANLFRGFIFARIPIGTFIFNMVCTGGKIAGSGFTPYMFNSLAKSARVKTFSEEKVSTLSSLSSSLSSSHALADCCCGLRLGFGHSFAK